MIRFITPLSKKFSDSYLGLQTQLLNMNLQNFKIPSIYLDFNQTFPFQMFPNQ